MTSEKIKKIILESTIDKVLKDLAVDSQRAVGKLVEMGSRFAGSGLSAQLIQKAQNLSANQNSPYYALIQDLAANTDHAKLKTFGLNIGYNAWGKGIKSLRQRQTELNIFLPWYLVIKIADNQKLAQVDRIIKEGKQLGIYFYFLDLRKSAAFNSAVTSLMRSHNDCAFVALFPAGQIIPQNMGAVMTCRSTLFLIDSQGSDFTAAAALLRQQKCFFGAYRAYDDASVEELIRGQWTEPIITAKTPLAFLLAEKNTSDQAVGLSFRYVNNERQAQRYPLLLIDIVEDCNQINKYIYKNEFKPLSVIDAAALPAEPLLKIIKA